MNIIDGRRTGLWSRDREAYWALAYVTGRRNRLGHRISPGQHLRYRTETRRQLKVIAAAAKLPYGRGTGKPHTDRTVSHVADLCLFAWEKGQLVGTMAVWLCGAYTTDFGLETEVLSRPCALCFLRRDGLGIQIHNSIVIIGRQDQ
jgi:hypothetical protein